MATNHNEMIFARMRGVPAKQVSKLEAMMDPTNPNRHEANDNAVCCALETPPAPVLSSAAVSDAANEERRPAPNLGPEAST
jgi:hypothetical protein